MITQSEFQLLSDKIRNAEKESGRIEGSVKLMAVSKTRSREDVSTAMGYGVTLFGENRVLEAVEKFAGLSNIQVNMIGHLQSNKVKRSVPFFNRIDSVDSFSLASKISKQAVLSGCIQSILLEENCSGEVSKSGFSSRDELLKNVETIRQLPGLKIEGLMTIAPFTHSESEVQRSFSNLRESFNLLKDREGLSEMFELSMGMSGDYLLAIKEGSTLVRIGQTIFGERSYV